MSATVSPLLHLGGAALCLLSGLVVVLVGRGIVAWTLALTCLASAGWAIAVAVSPAGVLGGTAAALEVVRNAAWFVALLVLYNRIAGPSGRGLLLRFVVAGAALVLLSLATLLPGIGIVTLPGFGSPALMARLGLDLLIVVLAENLFRNADEEARWHVNLPCIALGGLAAFDLVLFADAALSQTYSVALLDARAVLIGLAMPLLAIAAVRDRRARRGPPIPRRVMFHGATLIIAGTFLLGVGAAGEALRHIDTGWGSTAQASMLAGALMAAAVVAASATARSRLRNIIVDQFFTARYDYRKEWLRCIATLSAPDPGAPDPHIRAIRAIADAADSPGGVLLLREEPPNSAGAAQPPARLRWAGSWNLPAAPDHATGEALALLDPEGRITSLGTGATPAGLAAAVGPVWLAVPLLHHRDGPAGLVLLQAPRAPFTLDREADELLRTLGRAVAMFLAERRAAERLAEQRRVQDYAKHFAFVAHDVKTVSSQLEMLLANAEDNLQDPEFQHDMLVTVRASASRIKALIARLGQPGDAPRAEAATPGPASTAPLEALRAIVAGQAYPVRVEEAEGDGTPVAALRAAIPPDRFHAAVTHLVNNAAEASRPGEPVRLRVKADQGRVVVDVMDRGSGMSPEFIRDELFRPLATSKRDGSGIGAWQARELAREAGGDLTVLSELGVGTTMRLILPAVPPGVAPARTGGRQEGGG
jgi:putative PEP-CTERM system histidine kinase